MQIRNFANLINFKGATINVNALSDTHGRLESTDSAYQSMLRHDVFEKEKEGVQNFLIFGGDWFISGSKKGFLTNLDKPLMKFQAEMFNKFTAKIKEKFPKTKVVFIPGNHDLDAGVKLFHDTVRDIDADVVIGNLDSKESNGLRGAILEHKILESKVTFVADDKDPNKRHAVLNLGVSPVNMSYYQSDMTGMKLVDDIKKSQKFVEKEDYQKTFEKIQKQIATFKKQYPDGTVILTCHTGVGFAENCAKAGGIDIIFDGHEHKENVKIVEGTPIVSLSQNFKKIVNAKITIEDDGSKKGIEIESYDPTSEEYKAGELYKFYQELFKEDSKKIYTAKVKGGKIDSLEVKGIRGKNNHLANFVTDAILESIQECDPSVQIFAINASAIRGGFELEKGNKPNISPFEISNCLDGISENQAGIFSNEVSGRCLAMMVLDNFLFNRIDTEKNPMIQYAGIKVDRTNMMKDYEMGKRGSELCRHIILKETGKPIHPDKEYKIANVEKYFIKSTNEKIKALKEMAYPVGITAHKGFKDYFDRHRKIEIVPETRIY